MLGTELLTLQSPGVIDSLPAAAYLEKAYLDCVIHLLARQTEHLTSHFNSDIVSQDFKGSDIYQ